MQVKKAAEKAWESDKGQEGHMVTEKPVAKKSVIGSTKRVEQFRKNLRRWMIGMFSLCNESAPSPRPSLPIQILDPM